MAKSKFPGVKIISNPENLGFTKANNQGLKTSNGRYAILLNNDTVAKEGALDKLVEFMDQYPDIGACGPKLLNPDGSPQRQGSLLAKKFWLSPRAIETNFIIGAALLVRKQVVEKVGLLDENLFFYNEDLDWCLRIRKLGYKIMFIPQSEIIHLGGYSSKRSFNKKLFIEGFKGSLYFCKKHYGLLALLIYRVFLLISLLITLPFYLLIPKKAYWDKLSAYLEIFFLVTEIKI